MSKKSRKKRQYIRLSDNDWAAIRAEWESGEITLAELSHRYGASVRSLQNYFEQRGIVKGSARSAATAEALRLVASGPQPASPIDVEDAKNSTLRRILAIEEAIGAQLDLMRLDPTQAFRAGSTVKALQAAVDALGKSYNIKKDILGLDRPENDAKTELTVRVLFDEEIDRLQADDDFDDDDLPNIGNDDDDEIVVEEAA